MDKLKLLKKYWGYTQFRPHQEQIINCLLKGKDVMGVLPTGGGKSLCYQLPALIMEGMVLVISPLIALMEDQVNQLNKRGIKSMYFESHPKSISLQQQIDNCIHGNYKLVYTAPERFLNLAFIQQLSQAKVSLIAIDEAHCISEWGHDFRPSYRKLEVLRSLFPHSPIVALTASATSEVTKDVQNLLALKKPHFFQSSFERPNLAYHFWKTEDKFNTITQLLNFHKGSSIIYCNTRKQTEYLTQFINQSGHQAAFFHGGLLASEKKLKLNLWQQGEISSMVATTAFGMGIDKPDVRTVIHMQLPDSIENFYQQTGRAGRDQKPANSYLLFHQGDVQELKYQFLDHLPTQKDIKRIYKDLCNFLQIAYGEGKDVFFPLDLNHFCTLYDLRLSTTQHALKLFEQAGVFALVQTQEKEYRIQVTTTTDQINAYLRNETVPARVLEYLMRQNTHFFRDTTRLSPQKIGSALKLSKERLNNAFEALSQQGLIRFSTPQSSIYLCPLTPREDQYTLKPVLDLAAKMRALKKNKIEALIEFVKDQSHCKRNAILNYFGEHKTKDCQQCSAQTCSYSLVEQKVFKDKIISLLKTQPHSIQELKQKLYFEPQALQTLLMTLLDNEYIKEVAGRKFYWIHD